MMTPFGQDALIIAVIGLSTALTNFLNDRRAKKQDVVTDKIHTLVNSNFGEQLKINVVSARALYELTKSPLDKALLEEAQRRLAEHEAKQAMIDGGAT
jgi:hypothetical protein